MEQVSTEELVGELKTLMGDADQLLRATADEGSEQAGAARERIQLTLAALRSRLAIAGQGIASGTRAAARHTDEYVRENPWQAVGAAAGVGLLLGYILGRR